MVDFYQRRDPKYNVKCELHKAVSNNEGSSLYYDKVSSKRFYVKDNGFETIYTSESGHVEKITTGQIETRDLKDGDIMPDDYVNYAGRMYIVTKVRFSDDEMPKSVTKRASGITTIDLRG